MPLSSTGPVSIGGSTSSNSVNLQLGRAITAATSLNEGVTRVLAATSTTPNMPYSFSQFYGKGLVGGGVAQGAVGRWSVSSTAGTFAGPITAHATVNLFDNGGGQIVVAGAGAVGSPAWYIPATTAIGNSYWVRATLTDSGSLLISGSSSVTDSELGTYGVWLQLNTTRTWRVEKTLTRTGAGFSQGTLYRTITFEFSTSASGVPLVATHTGNTIRATPQLNAS